MTKACKNFRFKITAKSKYYKETFTQYNAKQKKKKQTDKGTLRKKEMRYKNIFPSLEFQQQSK